MPFDGLSEGLVSDLVKLRIALDGVRGGGWTQDRIGLKPEQDHCAIGWLLVAADGDRDEATRLALEYVYPALPVAARQRERVRSIVTYNDDGGQKRIERLFAEAARLAELRAAR